MSLRCHFATAAAFLLIPAFAHATQETITVTDSDPAFSSNAGYTYKVIDIYVTDSTTFRVDSISSVSSTNNNVSCVDFIIYSANQTVPQTANFSSLSQEANAVASFFDCAPQSGTPGPTQLMQGPAGPLQNGLYQLVVAPWDAAGNGGDHTVTFELEGVGFGSTPPSSNDTAEQVKNIILSAAERSTVSLVSSNRRMTQEARGRFISNLRQTSDGFVGRNNVAFGMEGDARTSNGQLSTKGSFFQQQGNDEGTYRRLFYGDFDVQKDKGTGSTTATLSGKLAWERMISENTMVGYFVGLDLGRSDIDGTFRGDQKSGGLQLGTYAVTELDKNIYLDGFLTVGAAKNKLDMTDGTLALDGTYISRMASFGGALTGVIEQDGYELWPELALTIGHTRVGVLDLNSRTAGVVGNTVAVDAGNVTIANLTLRPEVRMAADGRAMKDSRTLATFAPRVICESVKTTATNKDCGFGSEFGFSTRSENGMTIFDAKVILDKVGSSARRALQLKLEHWF